MLSWKSDPYLWWVFDSWISRKGSPTKLIQHSPALQQLYASHVRALMNPRISKMKYARQRFSSTAVPLQRCAMFLRLCGASALMCKPPGRVLTPPSTLANSRARLLPNRWCKQP